MRLASLLAQFLYTNKRLDLPGIGSFLLDPSVVIEAPDPRQAKATNLDGVTFEHNPRIQESPELIAYIASNAGKLKALAAADLDSHIELAKQFINIGKPFLFEGIGSLAKLQSGTFTFNPGPAILEKIADAAGREHHTNSISEESKLDYKSILYLKKIKRGWKKPITASLLLAGLAVAVLGGYIIYKKGVNQRNENVDKAPELVLSQQTTVPVADPVKNIPVNQPTTNNGTYKFIVETADKKRGLDRFELLKSWGLPVQMETPDSVNYKLFFILPAQAIDTTRLLDSLKRLYTPIGAMASIEK